MKRLFESKSKKLILLLGSLFLILIGSAMTLLMSVSVNVAYAATASDFLSYTGSTIMFKADVSYPSTVTSESSAENFEITLRSTEITWIWAIGPFLNTKAIMTRPDGITKEHEIKSGLISEHFTETLFTSDDLKDSEGRWVEGTYTVQASGNITGMASTNQNASFTFTVNINAPTITLDANNQELDSWDITSSNVTVSATDTDGEPTLKYGFSKTTNSVTAETTMLNGRELTEEGLYTVTAEDTLGRTTTKYFYIDRTAPTLSLSGVTDAGFTNTGVSASWSTAVGGAGAQRVSTSDSITVKYSYSTNSTFPATATTNYVSGTMLTNAGNYLMTIEDKTGNQRSYKFTIDKSSPALSLNGVENGGFTNNDVSFSWETGTGSISSQLSNANDGLEVLYSYNTDSTFPDTRSTEYTSGAVTAAGNYSVEIRDKAGNKTVYTFTIDKTAPTLSLSGVANGGFTNGNVSATWSTTVGGVNTQKANSSDTLTVRYAYTTSSNFPTEAGTSYASGNLTVAGNYLMEIADRAGNKTQYKFTIDKTAPILSLSGVANGGFTNGDVSFLWETGTGSISSQLSNANDGLEVLYSYNTDSTFPDTRSTEYTSGAITAAGNYSVEIRDKAGNKTVYTFTIDKTAPTLSFSGVANGGFTNGNVSATWSTTVGGVNTQRSNENDELTVTFALSEKSDYPQQGTQAYEQGTQWTSVGNYSVFIKDKAGNCGEYHFTIDRTAPELTLTGVQNDGLTKGNVSAAWGTETGSITSQLSNAGDALTATYSVLPGTEIPSDAATSYKSGTALSEEGNYLLVLRDKAGNTTEYRFAIDKTAPVILQMSEEYTNKTVEFKAEDIHGVTIEYRLNDGEAREQNAATLEIEGKEENNGVWEIRACDDAGNYTDWKTVKLYIRSNFGNSENVKNEYVTAVYYMVTLPEKNFPDIAGRYTFSTYEAALKFAIQKEWDYRVETLSTGWAYVNISQESVRQVYTSREELDKAINKYASANVSDRQIMGVNGINISNPTDENGETRPDAMTAQNLVLPDMLSKYNGLPLYFLAHDFTFATPKSGVDGNVSTLTFSYISDGISVNDGKEMTLRYGERIDDLLDSQGAWKQGYYLVCERDLCGNEEKYIVYIDTEKPTLTATVQLGNGDSNQIEFTQSYAEEYGSVMLYVGFNVETITDNIDEYVMVTFEGRGLDRVSYVKGDEIPYLSYENGYYGKYEITVYDRSLNALTFTVTIAGAAPSVTHSSLTSDIRCRLTIEVPDGNDAITAVNIYKISYDGERTKLTADDDGTPITAETLEYMLRTGGKYVVEIQDVFGRTIESEPMFYMKGLPSGILSGVKENGVTNNTVTFQYENTNEILVYIYKDGGWVAADSRATITERSGYNYATIEATEENSYQYKIFLYVASDMNLFVEYIFEIDSIPPSVDIVTDSGNIASGTVTRLPFRVTWTEFGVNAYYYNKNSTLGELSKTRYTKDTVISTAGTYVFEVYDAANNSITFEVTVDNSVSYTITGDYSVLEDGSYISKKSLTLTVTERTALWKCDSSNGISPTNGQVLTTDGTYSFVVQDMYGNELMVTLIIDNLPPVPVIETKDGDDLFMNSSTNQAFKVSCEEANVTMSYSTDGRTYSAYDGALFDEEQIYYFRLTDRMNNTVSFQIEIDRTVEYTLDGKYLEIDGGVTARSLTLTIDEVYKSFTAQSNNGVTVEPGKRITEEGTYNIEITDLTGNTAAFIIVIDLTPPTPVIHTTDGKTIEPNGSTNQAFTVKCDEAGSSIYWSESDGGYMAYEGNILSEKKKYYFRLQDALGNETLFTVTIDGEVKFNIDGKYTVDSAGRYVSNSWLAVNVEEEYTKFDVQTDSGRKFTAGEHVSLEGIYTVTVCDTANNEETIVLVIDKTPAEPKIRTADGVEIEVNGITNTAFAVTCDETDATIEYSRNNQAFSKYDGKLIEEARVWYFRLTDLAGNVNEFTVELDSGVDFVINGTYKTDNLGRYVSKNALSVSVAEDIASFNVYSNNGITFAAGERVETEGTYRVEITDNAGNIAEIVLVIDKTAPQPMIITTDEEALPMNGVTNQDFKVYCSESDAVVMWSERNGNYMAYDGREFTEAKRYYFRITDFIGNESTFTVEIERSVDYTVKGTYNEYPGYGYATATGVVLTIDEEYNSFEVTSNNGKSIVLGERITAEGVYNVAIEDLVGNRVEFIIEVDYTAPGIELSGIESGGVTGGDVGVTVKDFQTAYYTVSGQEGNVNIIAPVTLTDANKYTVVAIDRAGNRATASFTIDKSVDVSVSPTIIPGQIVTNSVTFEINEKANEIALLKDNQTVSFSGGTISEAGVYSLKIMDMYGNTVSYSWTIVPEAAKSYNFDFPDGYRVSVSKDESIVSDAVVGKTIALTESGIYRVVFNNGETEYAIKLTVDAVAPTVEIIQEKTKVIISNPSKENVTISLEKDGEAVDYKMGDTITATGEYRLTVTDEYGNETVYTFSLHYINTFGIIVIAIAGTIVLTIIIAMIVMRRKQGVR